MQNILDKVAKRKQLKGVIITKSIVVLMLFSISGFAQTMDAKKESSTWDAISNPLFVSLIGIIILLLIIISVLGNVLKNVAENNLKNSRNSSTSKILGIIALVALVGSQVKAQTTEIIASPSSSGVGGIDNFTFYSFLGIILLELIIITTIVRSINLLLYVEEREVEKMAAKKSEPSILEVLNASVPLEKEKDILLDHNYDGIQELDNNLPPWWKYGFYLTIVIGFVYLINYHVIKTGDLQGKEYEKELAQAEADMQEFRKKSANQVDESNVKMLADADNLAKGKEIFLANCAPCHGKLGEGTVGPNLTDEYWIHGGSIKDIFTTIKYGYPEKGMKAWQADISPVQINQLASFIRSIKGTNPPHPKDKQGDLYVEVVAKTDSLQVQTDSLKAKATVDSVSVN